MKVGDIIIVAKGSCMQLVLRACGSFYLFVGVCMLIDGSFLEFTADCSEISRIMSGSAWEEIGKSLEEEEFYIH